MLNLYQVILAHNSLLKNLSIFLPSIMNSIIILFLSKEIYKRIYMNVLSIIVSIRTLLCANTTTSETMKTSITRCLVFSNGAGDLDAGKDAFVSRLKVKLLLQSNDATRNGNRDNLLILPLPFTPGVSRTKEKRSETFRLIYRNTFFIFRKQPGNQGCFVN